MNQVTEVMDRIRTVMGRIMEAIPVHLLPYVTLGSLILTIIISIIGIHVEQRRDLNAQFGWVFAVQAIGATIAGISFGLYLAYGM
ncbi:hypothetical protein COO72_02515 [Bifidobacterium callitrichos]|nr:hypothetical protein COO72_02515 [Bifidobacterium callitrichos]